VRVCASFVPGIGMVSTELKRLGLRLERFYFRCASYDTLVNSGTRKHISAEQSEKRDMDKRYVPASCLHEFIVIHPT
jgi:hypothetical protein